MLGPAFYIASGTAAVLPASLITQSPGLALLPSLLGIGPLDPSSSTNLPARLVPPNTHASVLQMQVRCGGSEPRAGDAKSRGQEESRGEGQMCARADSLASCIA